MADTETPPGFTGVGYPEVFTVPPQQPTEKKVGQLTPEQLNTFFEEGFLVVENFFTPEELEPVKDSMADLVDIIAQKLYKAGKVKNLYEDHGLDDRLYMLEKEWKGAVMLLLKLGKLTPAFRTHYQNEKMLNVMEQMIGPEVAANPIWNTRPKTPGHAETQVPMHQDSAFFDMDSYKAMVVAAWTALNESTVENGCLQFLRYGHKKGMVGIHEGGDNFYLTIPDDELANRFGADPSKDLINATVKAGGVVFYSNVIPFCSIPNTTERIRWGMDFRYQSAKCPWGFWGLKPGILLRSPDQPDLQPDWVTYDGKDRYEEQRKFQIEKTGKKGDEEAEFNTIITGPWMDKWNMKHGNKHTDLFFEEKLNEAEKEK